MDKDFKYLVRIANTDIDGKKAIASALRKIKGVSFSFANAICTSTGIDKFKKTGELSDADVKKLNDAMTSTSDLPVWMFNRRKDVETGKDSHLITSQLDFTRDQDIRIMKKIKSYKGIRHSSGLPVRGQRTRSNFRRNKGSVMGVQRKGPKQSKT